MNASQLEPPPPGCNCRNGEACPMNGQCLTDHVIYGATVVDNLENTSSTYTGLTRDTFKKRWYKHRSDFKNENNKHSTTLSSHIWNLKGGGNDFEVNWRIIDRATEFNPSTKNCRLCLKEKYHI